MEPGIKLDGIIAREVMEMASCIQSNGNVLKFSTDIAAAWEVVEKIKRSKIDLEIELTSSSEFPEEWTVGIKWFEFFEGEEHQYGTFYFTKPTAPHAICLAALKAVGAMND